MYNIHPSSDKLKGERARKSKYPWHQLQIGQSFEVPDSEVVVETLKSLAYRTGKRTGKRFEVAHHPELKVYEVGRKADPVKETVLPAPVVTLRGFQPIGDNPRPVGDGSTAPIGWPLPEDNKE